MNTTRAFTLIELLVVVAIIGLLAGLVGPNLFRQADRAKTQTAETQVNMLRGAIHTFRLDVGRLPTEEEGLRKLVLPRALPAYKNSLAIAANCDLKRSAAPQSPVREATSRHEACLLHD